MVMSVLGSEIQRVWSDHDRVSNPRFDTISLQNPEALMIRTIGRNGLGPPEGGLVGRSEGRCAPNFLMPSLESNSQIEDSSK